MEIIVRGDTPFETLVACVKLYRVTKQCFKNKPESYRLKGISLYLGEGGAKSLDEVMSDYERT